MPFFHLFTFVAISCCEACYGSHPFVRMAECNHSLEWLNYIRGTQMKTKNISYSRIAISGYPMLRHPPRRHLAAYWFGIIILVSAVGPIGRMHVSSAMMLIYAKCGEIRVLIRYNTGSGMDQCVLITTLHDWSIEISHRRSNIDRPVG